MASQVSCSAAMSGSAMCSTPRAVSSRSPVKAYSHGQMAANQHNGHEHQDARQALQLAECQPDQCRGKGAEALHADEVAEHTDNQGGQRQEEQEFD